MIVPSWLVTILAWAPAAGMKVEKTKEVPGIYKLVLPLLLFAVLGTMVAITIFAIIETLKKRVPLEETEGANIPPLGSGEMTKYERDSRIAPAMGKIMAVGLIIGLLAMMMGGMYTMGKGSSTTDQLRKEGAERQKKADARKRASEASGGGEIGGDDKGSSSKGSEFGGGLDGMK